MAGTRVARAQPQRRFVEDAREEIARVAYELFERRGRVDGFDQQDWLEAERIVLARQRGWMAAARG